MRKVGSRELKNRLGTYLRIVRNGSPIQVTDRGRPVACLIPSGSKDGKDETTLARLVTSGVVTLGFGSIGPHRPARLKKGKTIVEMLAEDRR